MNYLNFFKVRPDFQSIRQNIEAFEQKNTINLPPYYKSFIENYDTNKRIEDIISVYLPQFDTQSCFMHSYYQNDKDNILFYNFFELDEIMKNMKVVYPEDHEIWKQEFLAIGECAFQIYLLVGIGEHNKDKIYAESATEKVKLRYLCDNIYDFFRDYIVEIDESCLPKGKCATDLYKNWGEDFYRIRE